MVTQQVLRAEGATEGGLPLWPGCAAARERWGGRDTLPGETGCGEGRELGEQCRLRWPSSRQWPLSAGAAGWRRHFVLALLLAVTLLLSYRPSLVRRT